jgi:hypothetical protein
MPDKRRIGRTIEHRVAEQGRGDLGNVERTLGCPGEAAGIEYLIDRHRISGRTNAEGYQC